VEWTAALWAADCVLGRDCVELRVGVECLSGVFEFRMRGALVAAVTGEASRSPPRGACSRLADHFAQLQAAPHWCRRMLSSRCHLTCVPTHPRLPIPLFLSPPDPLCRSARASPSSLTRRQSRGARRSRGVRRRGCRVSRLAPSRGRRGFSVRSPCPASSRVPPSAASTGQCMWEARRMGGRLRRSRVGHGPELAQRPYKTVIQ